MPFWAIPPDHETMRYTRKEFEKMIDKATLKLSPKAQKLLDEVPILLEKRPELQIGVSSWGILAQFVGSIKGTSGLYPPVIKIYQEDIEFVNRQCEEKFVIDHLSHILAHELCHYLGANEIEADLLKNNMLKMRGTNGKKEGALHRIGRFFRKTFSK